jgi:hypothetical protein
MNRPNFRPTNHIPANQSDSNFASSANEWHTPPHPSCPTRELGALRRACAITVVAPFGEQYVKVTPDRVRDVGFGHRRDCYCK